MHKVSWKDEPEDHDYPAAASYLALLARADQVTALIERLKVVPVEHFKAKDILRAAALPLLPENDPHVASDLRKVSAGKELSPILLVRGDRARGLPLQIADGYHRVCASYHVDENTDIPCHLADWPG